LGKIVGTGLFLLTFFSTILAGGTAPGAQEAPGGALSGGAANFIISEIRAGVLAHSIDERGPNGELLNLSRLEDISFEILFFSPDIDAFRWIGSPRPSLGVTLNLAGRENLAHLGLTWQLPIFETAFFLEGTLGAALHDGALNGATFPARNLGCRVMIYESGGLGMNIGENFTIIAQIEHTSSAKLCMPNEGLTNLGIKVGYKF